MESTLIQTQLPHRISLSQAAQISGYHQDYLGQLCRLGKLRAAKIGRNWYTTQSELQSLINNSEAYGMLSEALAAPTEQSESDEEVAERAMQVPVVASNYVISEVEDLPIRLEERPRVAGSHHTLQTLITRMKLDELRTEVLEVTGLIDRISDEVSNHTEILNRHEQLLQARSDLREMYSPGLSVNLSTKPRIDLVSQPSLDEPTNSRGIVWLWPALTLLLAVVVSSLFIMSYNTDTQPQLSTVIYKTPKVAGDQTTEISPNPQ